jgi:hypothetical protein
MKETVLCIGIPRFVSAFSQPDFETTRSSLGLSENTTRPQTAAYYPVFLIKTCVSFKRHRVCYPDLTNRIPGQDSAYESLVKRDPDQFYINSIIVMLDGSAVSH